MKMKWYHKRRMQKMIDFLKKLPRKEFYYDAIVKESDENGCGTVCCAMGWLPKIDPKYWKWNSSGFNGYLNVLFKKKKIWDNWDISHYVSKYFNIPYADVKSLFYWYNFDGGSNGGKLLNSDYNTNKFKPLKYNATPKQVAHNLETYLKIVAK